MSDSSLLEGKNEALDRLRAMNSQNTVGSGVNFPNNTNNRGYASHRQAHSTGDRVEMDKGMDAQELSSHLKGK